MNSLGYLYVCFLSVLCWKWVSDSSRIHPSHRHPNGHTSTSVGYPAYRPASSSVEFVPVCQFPITWVTPVLELHEGPTIQHGHTAVLPSTGVTEPTTTQSN